jgi:RNA-directed DNA polymerase
METCEWLGNLTSKSIDRFAVETVRKPLRNLLAMNVPRRQVIPRKSLEDPWHMAKTIASCVGMANAWLAEQGVLSLKSLWAELADFH